MGVLTTKFHLKSKNFAKLPVAVEAAEDNSKCPICQETVGAPTADSIVETWSSLPCSHSFGSHCIKIWLGLSEQPTCPICRRDMAHLCGHPVLPTPTSKRNKLRKKPTLQQACSYCTKARWKSPKRGVVARVALGALKVLAPRKTTENFDRLYWEAWRKHHDRGFGEWWALQDPPTEPATAAPIQGWVS